MSKIFSPQPPHPTRLPRFCWNKANAENPFHRKNQPTRFGKDTGVGKPVCSPLPFPKSRPLLTPNLVMPSIVGRANAMMPSLCESCRNLREVRTARSRFLLCELSVTSADYPKYPP